MKTKGRANFRILIDKSGTSETLAAILTRINGFLRQGQLRATALFVPNRDELLPEKEGIQKWVILRPTSPPDFPTFKSRAPSVSSA
jgi:hypothetical protein